MAQRRWSYVTGRDGLRHWYDANFAPEILVNVAIIPDAIDNITTKVDLLKYCYENGIKVTLPLRCTTHELTCSKGDIINGRRLKIRPKPNSNLRYILYNGRFLEPSGSRTTTQSRDFYWDTSHLLD